MRAIDADRCYFAKVIRGKFVVEKSMKNADFARVPKMGTTYVKASNRATRDKLVDSRQVVKIVAR